MGKSADAFRTISEVAEWLEVPTHVLRFWESKFTQVKPVKRAGGRRYYRPADMRLLGGIKVLLHDEGLTIKGVQKMLREQGVRHVAALAPSFEAEDGAHAGGQVLDFVKRDAPADIVPTEIAAPAQTAAPSEQPPPPTAEPPSESAPAPGMENANQGQPGPDPAAAETPEPEPESDILSTAPPEPTPAPEPEPEPSFVPDAAPEPTADTAPSPAPPPTPHAPALPPLPELPSDPPDDLAAPPGALTRLASLPRPLPTDLAATLSALADRLREAGAPKA